jgi:hypothetical protein
MIILKEIKSVNRDYLAHRMQIEIIKLMNKVNKNRM